MSVRDDAQIDYENGMKYKEIATKYSVSESTVKTWASRYWNKDKLLKKSRYQSQRATKPAKKQNYRGAPKGSKNAIGNKGGAPPFGSQNALKHGGYSAVYWDTLDEEERAMIEELPDTEEDLLLDQIKLFSVRERRVLKAMDKYRNQKNEQVINNIVRSEDKRTFRTDDDKNLYEEIQREKVANGDKLPGSAYRITTCIENADNVLARLEKELTQIQRAKTKAIDSLLKLNIEKERLALIREKDDIEIEDTSEMDELIYG